MIENEETSGGSFGHNDDSEGRVITDSSSIRLSTRDLQALYAYALEQHAEHFNDLPHDYANNHDSALDLLRIAGVVSPLLFQQENDSSYILTALPSQISLLSGLINLYQDKVSTLNQILSQHTVDHFIPEKAYQSLLCQFAFSLTSLINQETMTQQPLQEQLKMAFDILQIKNFGLRSDPDAGSELSLLVSSDEELLLKNFNDILINDVSSQEQHVSLAFIKQKIENRADQDKIQQDVKAWLNRPTPKRTDVAPPYVFAHVHVLARFQTLNTRIQEILSSPTDSNIVFKKKYYFKKTSYF